MNPTDELLMKREELLMKIDEIDSKIRMYKWQAIEELLEVSGKRFEATMELDTSRLFIKLRSFGKVPNNLVKVFERLVDVDGANFEIYGEVPHIRFYSVEKFIEFVKKFAVIINDKEVAYRE